MVAAECVQVSEHGFQELEEDGIFPDEVTGTVETGLVVEDYPDAWKGPTVLVRQTLANGRHFHAMGILEDQRSRGRPDNGLFPRSWSVVAGFPVERTSMTKRVTKLIREGNYVAEVRVDLIPDDGAWGPYLSHEDAMKLSRVRRALRAGNIADAKQEADIFELTPA